MNRDVKVRKRDTSNLAWKYTGQDEEEWPSWIKRMCRGTSALNNELMLDRTAGYQRVPPDHYVINSGGLILVVTPEAFERDYETVDGKETD